MVLCHVVLGFTRIKARMTERVPQRSGGISPYTPAGQLSNPLNAAASRSRQATVLFCSSASISEAL